MSKMILKLTDTTYNNRGKMKEEEKNYNNNYTNNQEFSNKEGIHEPIPQDGELPEEEQFFKDFNNAEIDNRDPSLGDSLLKIYEEEIPFEIRYEDENLPEKDRNVFQNLICKILITDEMLNEINVKIEIINDSDLFFYYYIDLNSSSFEKMKEEQKLVCNFREFSDLLIKYFDLCMNDKKTYLTILNVQKDNKVILELLENLDFKFGQLVNLCLLPASEDLIRRQIIYRYNSMRATENIMENRINIINNVLKDVDPQLIFEVKRETSKVKIEKHLLNIK